MRVIRAQQSRLLPRLCAVTVAVTASTATVLSAGPAAATQPGVRAPAAAGAVASPPQSAAPAATRGVDGLRVTDVAVAAVPASQQNKTLDALAIGTATLGSGKLLAHVRRPVIHPFSMLGVTWNHQASGKPITIEVRTRSGTGWSAWSELETDADGGPLSPVHDSGFRDGTEPSWVGDASGVELAAFGHGASPRGLTVNTIDPGSSPYSAGMLAKQTPVDNAKPGTFPSIPQIVTRSEWGADESLGDRCWSPRYGHTFKAVIVHHTAGSNGYSRADSAAMVRGIYAYHTEARHWCDIGYNFLIDRFGTIYEGRAGGIRRSVRGAHSGDYNVNTTGVSLMGNFDIALPTHRMKSALVKLVAWRLGTAYHGAYGHPYLFDGRFKRISGHRDVMQTACPGAHVYSWLPKLRRLVANRLGGYESRIQRAWRSGGAMTNPLGLVKVGEQGGDGGRHTTFQHGRMYMSDGRLHTFYLGPVLRRYVAARETRGPLGYPVSNVWRVDGHSGYAAAFQGGRIYWSSATGGEVLVRGAVLKRYLTGRGAAGRLGFPKSGLVRRHNVTRGHFQHGSITYSRITHRTIVRYR